MYNIIAQSIGFIGLFLTVWAFQNKQRKGILFFLILSSFVFFFHFVLLGALTGAITNLVGAARNSVFYNREKAWANNKIWLFLFLIIFSASTLFTWKNIFSILPLIAALLGTISLWMKNPKYIRLLILVTPPCWFIYNMVSGSIPGMLTEIFNFSSIVVGIIRFDIRKTATEKL